MLREVSAMDEFVVALRPQRAWSTLVAWDLLLSGTGAGLFFLAVLLRWFGGISPSASLLGGWLALALVGAGGLVLTADLGTPSRLLLVFKRPTVSWVSRGAWTMLLLLAFGCLTLLPSLPGLGFLPWGAGTPAGVVLEVVVLVLAFALMTYTGLLLSSWSAIPFWNTPVLPALFVTSCLLGATGALLVIAASFGLPLGGLGVLALCLILAVSFQLLLYLAVMRGGTSAARESVRLLLSGPDAGCFIRRVIVVGLIAPAVLLGAHLGLGLSGAVAPVVAAIAILLGTFELRSAVLRAGVYRA